MIKKSLAVSYGLAFAVSTAIVSVAFAQSAEPSEQITVIAPYLVQKKEATGPNLHTKVFEISAERRISYSDLDLANPADDAKFEQRINAAAAEACAQLDRQYPQSVYVPVSDSKSCVKQATDQAMATAREVIGASQKRG